MYLDGGRSGEESDCIRIPLGRLHRPPCARASRRAPLPGHDGVRLGGGEPYTRGNTTKTRLEPALCGCVYLFARLRRGINQRAVTPAILWSAAQVHFRGNTDNLHSTTQPKTPACVRAG